MFVRHRPTTRLAALALLRVAPLLFARPASAGQTLSPRMHHLRWGAGREWADFPEKAESAELRVRFDATVNPAERTLRLRHRDLKQIWRVSLNGEEVAALPRDEPETVTFWAVPPGVLRDGQNELRVWCSAKPPAANAAPGSTSDDVFVGEVELLDVPRQQALGEATAHLTVLDADRGTPLPCRLTIVDARGALVGLGTASDVRLAVRPGVVYTADGRARVSLPAGRYTVYAGRGFAYSLDSAQLDLRPGDVAGRTLRIRRVVPTDGYVSADTHLHTFSYSRHGDATLEERVITLAGEGIELPIATDHNLQVDYDAAAKTAGVRQHFTPVTGNEVTTSALGHFNAFPLRAGGKLPNWRAPTWAGVRRSIDAAAAGDAAKDAAGAGVAAGGRPDLVVILNHACDLHGGFRPFDPSRHVAFTGEDLDGWDLPANAMEVVNSGATQSDPLRLYRAWFGLLNRGRSVTPIGSSDSHDVSRYIVGQARTYVRADGSDPGRVDVAQAVRGFREGRVLVSYGLLADLSVADRFGPGDTVPRDAAAGPQGLPVTIRVLGPEWTRATGVTLFANGFPVREAEIRRPAGGAEPAGVKWQETWVLPRPAHDVWLTVVAAGPGVTGPYWPMARPYQPTSAEWKDYVIGSSGAVRVDVDGSGRFDSAYEYAERVVKAAGGDVGKTVTALADYDAAVAAQAAGILRRQTPDGFEGTARAAIREAQPAVRAGFEQFLTAWAESSAARASKGRRVKPE